MSLDTAIFLLNLFTGLRRQFSEDFSRRIHPVSASSAPLRFNLSLLVSARKYGPFIRAARSFRASEPTKKWVNAKAQRAQSCHSTPQFFVKFVYGVEATVLRRFRLSNPPSLCVLCASAFQSFPTRVCQKVPPLHSPRYDAHVFGVSNTRTSSSLSSASCNGVCSQFQIAMAMFSTVGFTSRKVLDVFVQMFVVQPIDNLGPHDFLQQLDRQHLR